MLLTALQELEETIAHFQGELSNYPPFRAYLTQLSAQITDIFHQRFLPIVETYPNFSADLTEMHRLIKLLELDVMLLRSAKQSATQLQRLNNCQQHLNTLSAFCQKINNQI